MKEARVEFSELKFAMPATKRAQYSKLKVGNYLMLVFFVAEERQHSFCDAYTSKNSIVIALSICLDVSCRSVEIQLNLWLALHSNNALPMTKGFI